MKAEKNKLIAEFMGFQKTTIGWYDNEEALHFNSDSNTFDELEFHSSWDWLMPVVDKCYQEHMSKNISEAVMTCDIDIVYAQVVEFIKEYNQ